MPIFLHNFGQDKPDEDLANLMLDKVRTYHAGSGAELVYDHRYVMSTGEPPKDSVKEWIIRDPRETRSGTVNELMLESARSMCEGLHEGWMLATKGSRDKAAARAKARQEAKERKHNVEVAWGRENRRVVDFLPKEKTK